LIPAHGRWLAIRVLVFAALAMLYYAAATEHARRVNVSKARGDQSGYLWDAQNVYHNWHGRTPPTLIGERNRMPLYAGYLALFYSPEISDDEYFIVGKKWNIRLSLALLAILAAIFAWHLPPLASTNLTLIVAFGYFVFKAGYAQSELLFYFLFFATFLALCYALETRNARVRWLAALAGGALAALAHLTKASVLPLVAVFLIVSIGRELIGVARGAHTRPRLAAPALVLVVFLAVLFPYLANSKARFGHYFYNVNTTFYAWYDNWAQASAGTILHGDGVGWPTLPADQIPSARQYWRAHTIPQIASRIGGGFKDILVRSYTTYWYFNYVLLYLAIAIAVLAANRSACLELLRRHRALVIFLAGYASVYALSIAFYEPISGTGTARFVIAHLTPFFFTLSYFFAHPRVSGTEWTVAGTRITLRHVHLLVAVMLALDLAFWIWPRVMTTYGGF
jgi:hypothetical protein